MCKNGILNEKIECKICGRECKSHASLGTHLRKKHNVLSEDYYIKYIKTENEGKCKNKDCNNVVKFISLKNGYKGYECSSPNNFCSSKCSANDEDVRNKFNETTEKLYGDKNYRNLEKHAETSMKNWGVKNPSSSPIVKEIRRQSIQKTYGVDNVFQTEKVKDDIRTHFEESGYWLSDEEAKLNYKNYYDRCISHTRMNKKELFNNWDGYDYYDEEYIKDNLVLFKGNSNHPEYPTIDHIIPIKEGFKQNIELLEITALSNLVITKRKNNNFKSTLNVKEFKQKMGFL